MRAIVLLGGPLRIESVVKDYQGNDVEVVTRYLDISDRNEE